MTTELRFSSLLSLATRSLTASLLALTATSAALAEGPAQAGTYTDDGNLVVSFQQCTQANGCAFDTQGFGKIRILGTRTVPGDTGYQVGYQGGPISSNLPIVSIRVCSYNDAILTSNGSEVLLDQTRVSTNGGCKWYAVSGRSVSRIRYSNSDHPISVVGLMLNASALDTPTALIANSSIFAAYFSNSLDLLTRFEQGIKGSDRPHVNRLRGALNQALKDLVDPKTSNLLVPVTSDVIREDARMVMVYATVLNQLLMDYADVESVKPIVSSLMQISGQIRKDYGWGDDGIGGRASKSFSALAGVVDLELRDLYLMMAAFSTDAGPTSAIMKLNSRILTVDRASQAGDIAALTDVKVFAAAWNDKTWQDMLARLMAAPSDYQGQIQSRLKLLLTAIEGMSDLSGERFSIGPTLNPLLQSGPQSSGVLKAK